MFVTNIVLAFVSVFSVFAKDSGLFKRFLIHGNRWSKFVYESSQFSTRNPFECGSLCLTQTDCEMYALHNRLCYLGNFDSDTGYLEASSSRDKVYVDIDKVIGFFGAFYPIPKVSSPVLWGRYIFKTEAMLSTETEQDCSFLCSIAESVNGCQLFALWIQIMDKTISFKLFLT